MEWTRVIKLHSGHETIVPYEFPVIHNYYVHLPSVRGRVTYIKRGQVAGEFGRLHRDVWEWKHGPIPKGMQVDHADQDGLNNTLSNLR